MVEPELKGYHTIPSNQPTDAGVTQPEQVSQAAGQLVHALMQSVHSEQPPGPTYVTRFDESIGFNGPLSCESPEVPERLPFRFAKPQSLNHQPAQI